MRGYLLGGTVLALSACGGPAAPPPPAPAPESSTSSPVDLWESRVHVSGLTDEKTALITLKSARYASSFGPTQATLQLQCSDGAPKVYWTFNEVFDATLSMDSAVYGDTTVEAGKYTVIQYRLDQAKAESFFAIISANGTTLRLADMGIIKPGEFIKQLENTKYLTIGVSPYREPDREVFFPVEGLALHMADFRTLCPNL